MRISDWSSDVCSSDLWWCWNVTELNQRINAMNLSLRLDDLRDAYRSGELTPRNLLLSLREKAAALNPDYHLFIHLLTPGELEPYLAALEGQALENLPLYGVPFRSAERRVRTVGDSMCRSRWGRY